MSKVYKPNEAAKVLGVSVSTLQRWDREGKLHAFRNVANRRYYTEEQLNRLLGVPEQRKNVAYARVSSQRQKNNLKNQMDFITQYCNAKGIILDERISDIGSGLNYRRPKWNKLLQDVEDKKIAKIFITYKDRFTRFGFDWFEDFCQRHGTEIVVLNNPDTSPDQELVEDLMSVIHVFSCRLDGLRRYKKEIAEAPNLPHKEEGD